jgi:hypothetical protein
LVKDKELVAIISKVDHVACTLEIALVDTTGDDDVHINNVLVQEGLALYRMTKLIEWGDHVDPAFVY